MAMSQNREFDKVLEHIEFKIFSKILRPKERLIEREIMEEYQISRDTVRKILKELSFKHLIKHSANKGSVVAEPTRAEVDDIYQTRILLESYAIDFVTSNIEDAGLEKIKSYELDFEKSLEEENLRGLFMYNRLFHGAIFETCNNHVVSEMIDQLRKRSHIWYNYFAGNPQHRKMSIKEHNIMIECLERRDATKLKKVNKKHLSRGYNSYKTDLRTT